MENNNKKIYLILGGVFIFLIALLGMMVLLNSSKKNNVTQNDENSINDQAVSNSSNGSKVLATVNGKKIYESDVKMEAEKTYSTAAINQNVMNETLKKMEEKIILDEEAKRLNINIPDNQIADIIKARTGKTDTSSVNSDYTENIKLELLRNAVLQKDIESRTAYAISYWVPPLSEKSSYTEGQWNAIENQRSLGSQALDEAEKRMKNAEEPFTIAQSLYDRYPALRSRLGLNDYKLGKDSDTSIFTNPKIYVYSLDKTEKIFFDTLFSMNVNEIKKVTFDDGMGGAVILLKSINHSNYKTYEDWLKSKQQ